MYHDDLKTANSAYIQSSISSSSCLLHQGKSEYKPLQHGLLLWLCILFNKVALFEILGILGVVKVALI